MIGEGQRLGSISSSRQALQDTAILVLFRSLGSHTVQQARTLTSQMQLTKCQAKYGVNVPQTKRCCCKQFLTPVFYLKYEGFDHLMVHPIKFKFWDVLK